MHQKAKILLLVMGLGLLPWFFPGLVLAEPSEPARVVNHKTRECALIGTGDECQTCVPTGDWEYLLGDCPEGYVQRSDDVPNACTFSGNQICCQNSPDLYPCQPTVAPSDPNYILIGIVVVAFLSAILIVLGSQKDRLRHP